MLDNDVLDFTVYNEKMSYTIDDIADFILTHYTLSSRSDTEFWKEMNILGKKLNHDRLVWEKYNHPNNSMVGAITGYTMFPDYMWAQLGNSWSVEHQRSKTLNTVTKELAELHFSAVEKKHSIISNSRTNSYEWLKENIFQGLSSKEWEEKYINRPY
jgi:hypothetical protein